MVSALNGNAWIGRALVVTQRGQSVYLHTHGDLKKIAACRVKPFELVNSGENILKTKEVMKEDGLVDIDSLYTEDLSNYYYNKKHTHKIQYAATPKDRNKTEDLYKNTETQTLATSMYISFEDACTYTVQVLVSEH